MVWELRTRDPLLIILAGFHDPRFWTESEELINTNNSRITIFTKIVSENSAWVINDPRFREVADKMGAVDYSREHTLSDFCDGTFESWICELHDDH